MDRFIEFASLNWYLFLAFFVVLFVIIGSNLKQRMSGIVSISSQALLRLSNDDEAVIIDVRDGSVFKNGHVPASINVPMADINIKIEALAEKYKTKSVILVCQTGVRAYQAASSFKKYTFPAIYTLNGGIDNWKQDNLPLSKHK
ncbi:sulfurtransferase [Gammaproteobacteria bacterium]|nr:sulfurtransferase [Gammaproteobacteria bacterium]